MPEDYYDSFDGDINKDGYVTPADNLLAPDQDRENKIVNLALTEMPVPYISGLKLNADIQINGLTLNTIEMPNPATYGATPDPSRRINNFYGAVVWVVSDIDGWWNLPDPELPDLPRGWGDGSYGAVGRYASRIVDLTGSFLTQYPQDAPIARNFLIEAVNLVKTGGWLIVSEDFEADRSLVSFPSNPVGGDSYIDPTTSLGWSWSVLRDMWLPNGKASYVRLNGTPQIANVNARGRHDFSIGLKAVDPIKYEYVDGAADGYNLAVITADSSGNGQVIVKNTGNVPVPILLELSQGFVAGSATLITNNTQVPQTIKITGSTAANTALEIDTYNREALLVQYTSGAVTNVANGRANLSVLLNWIYLEPGNNVITVSGFPASATCYVYYRSGWIG
jgi:hypothetical protein